MSEKPKVRMSEIKIGDIFVSPFGKYYQVSCFGDNDTVKLLDYGETDKYLWTTERQLARLVNKHNYLRFPYIYGEKQLPQEHNDALIRYMNGVTA